MPKSPSASTIGQAIGRGLAELRRQKGLSQEEAAGLLRRFGLSWTRAHLASLETGRREDLTLAEMLLLSAAFQVPLERWFDGDGPVQLNDLASMDRAGVRMALRGVEPSGSVRLSVPELAAMPFKRYAQIVFGDDSVPTEAEIHTARRLGVAPWQVQEAARRVWDGRRLDEERDRRLGEMGGDGERRARRGHVTRALLVELQGEVSASSTLTATPTLESE